MSNQEKKLVKNYLIKTAMDYAPPPPEPESAYVYKMEVKKTINSNGEAADYLKWLGDTLGHLNPGCKLSNYKFTDDMAGVLENANLSSSMKNGKVAVKGIGQLALKAVNEALDGGVGSSKYLNVYKKFFNGDSSAMNWADLAHAYMAVNHPGIQIQGPGREGWDEWLGAKEWAEKMFPIVGQIAGAAEANFIKELQKIEVIGTDSR